MEYQIIEVRRSKTGLYFVSLQNESGDGTVVSVEIRGHEAAAYGGRIGEIVSVRLDEVCNG